MVARTLSDQDLAHQLLTGLTAPSEYIEEAARRLREHDFRELQTMMETITAITESPLISDEQSIAAGQIITSIPMSRKGFARVSGLAGRIIRGSPYSDADVLELAAFAIAAETESRDDTERSDT